MVRLRSPNFVTLCFDLVLFICGFYGLVLIMEIVVLAKIL